MRRKRTEPEILDMLADHALKQYVGGHTKSLRPAAGENDPDLHYRNRITVPKRSLSHAPRLTLGTGVCPHCGGKSARQNVAGNYWCYVCGWWQYDGQQGEV